MKTKIDIICGFIGSGKTTLLNQLVDYALSKDESTLVIQYEKGNTPFDRKHLRNNNLHFAEPRAKTPDAETLSALIQRYAPQRLIVEYNGTWELEPFIKLLESSAMRKMAYINSISGVADGGTLPVYLKNLGTFFREPLEKSDYLFLTNDSTSLAGRTVDMGGTGVAQDMPLNVIPSDGDIPLDVDAAGIVPMGGKVVIDDKNFVVWLTALYMRPEEHKGLELEISGFVFKNEELEADTFLLARFVMTCCTADMQLSGILSHYDHAAKLNVDTWLRVNGTLTVEMFNNRPIPALAVEQITEIEKPEIPYVFP